MNPTVDLDAFVLAEGAHQSLEDGACIMELVSCLADEPWSDHPQCVSPAVGAFLRSWNDTLDEDDRNRLLKPYLHKVIGTNTGPADEQTRAWLACDWLVRMFTPTWLRRAGLDDDAVALEALTPLTSVELADAAMYAIKKARAASDAASDAAWDAARAAARAAAWAATSDAASAAAWDATRAAARAATSAAASDAARDAAWATAWAAAWAAVWAAASAATSAAAWAAAWAAARAATSAAAWDATWDALADTVRSLQQSACDLLDRMIAVGKDAA
jgi:hypothetical protein